TILFLKISKNGLITTLACGPEGNTVYALEGSVFIGGAVVQWLRDYMKFFKESKDTFKIVKTLKQEDDIVFVPAFAGLGAPHWDMNARGAIYGITRDTNHAQIIRAALKSIALQSYELVSAMENDTGKSLKILKVDGGATNNEYLMQYQADILGKKVQRPDNVDTTVLGAAYLAGLECKVFSSVEDLKAMNKKFKEFKPAMKEEVRNREIEKWNTAIVKTKTV
ncbi:MAG TPA: FGGY-family carbohydrate kinase, partial [Leptospiraceae bacterium]|nr:FGGY-family carbohydrate kinase [Leptospiraceae bacterium]